MAARVYFYKNEKGETKKYVYCTLCSAGPFKEEDEKTKYKKSGGSHAQNYCLKCARILGLNDVPEFKPEELITALMVQETPEEKARKELRKKIKNEIFKEGSIPTSGEYIVYIGQKFDDTYVCGVTTDLSAESSFPIEIVYYRTTDDKETAELTKELIESSSVEQIEYLVVLFEKSYFPEKYSQSIAA